MKGMLTLFLSAPVVVSIVLLFVHPSKHRVFFRSSALLGILQLIFLGWFTLHMFKLEKSILWMESATWIESLHIQYSVGLDGLSLALCWLAAVIFWIALLASHQIQKRIKAYFILMLILQTGVYGVLMSMDLFLFYIFWEVALIPLYFLIGIWGGERREYAAIKFFIYTMLGSVFLLLGVILLYYLNPTHLALNIAHLVKHQHWIAQSGVVLFGLPLSVVVFVSLFLGFAIKVPVFPFHTWLPDAHVQAPTPISVILAGILLKLGVFGLLRWLLGLVPTEVSHFATLIFVLGLINLIYGGFCAMYQKNYKKLIAYSSVSHMGYCLMGFAALTTLGLQGAMLQMLSHGLIAAMLFLIAGMLSYRTYTLDFVNLGGVSHSMKKLTFFAVFASFASMGLPGLFGFVSEFMVFAGSFLSKADPQGLWGQGSHFFQIATLVGLSGVLIGAVYMLWALQRVFFGPSEQKWSNIQDLKPGEVSLLLILAVLIVYFGLQPSIILEWTQHNTFEWLAWTGRIL